MSVYEPAEDSFLLQRFVRQYAVGRILDLGTGTGILALTALGNPLSREVVAADINPDAVYQLHEKKNREKIRKLKVLESDLFEKVQGSFNLIIFNPPYLPQDKGMEDKAIYGGKKGWELSEKFFREVSSHLFPDGNILFLFSSLTGKEKVEEIIKNNLLEFQELDKQKLAFEELFVYLVKKTALLRELERKSICKVSYFTHGKRGDIFTGFLDESQRVKTHLSQPKTIKVAIKTKRKESKAGQRIENEIKWLKILNREGIGPRLIVWGDNYLVYEWVEGKFILDWIKESSGTEVRRMLWAILKQCLKLDKLKVDKGEMHHPLKHVIVDHLHQPVLIDFERCRQTDKPKNTTQFLEFLSRSKEELERKGISLERGLLRRLAQEYKQSYDSSCWESIKKMLTP